ncbi:MAG: Gfo/Idh/MocA family oxidoreductase [Planctomycetaceae bacterium]
MPIPSDLSPVRVGVIGLGRRGMHHLERFRLRSDIIAVAAHDADANRAPLAEAFGIRFHRKPKDVLEDPEVDAVLVATPPRRHRSVVCDAVAAGKHVLVERPLSDAPRDAARMIAAAGEAGRMLAVLQPRRFDGDFRTARETLRSGSLGELKKARLAVLGLEIPPRSNVPADPHESLGVLLNRGADYLDQLVDLDSSRPRRIFARVGSLDPATGRERAFTAFVDFESGVEAHLEVDLDHPAELRTGWTLTGTAGSYRKFRHYTIAADGEVIDVPLDPLPDEPDRIYDELVAHLRVGEPLAVSPERAQTVVALLDAARRSAKQGRPIPL